MDSTMVAVTPEDRALVYSLLIPAAHTELQKLALEYIRDGKSDDCDAVQSVARHRIQSEGRTEAADEIASLRARVEVMRPAMERWGYLLAEAHGCMKAEAKDGNHMATLLAPRLHAAYNEIADILDAPDAG